VLRWCGFSQLKTDRSSKLKQNHFSDFLDNEVIKSPNSEFDVLVVIRLQISLEINQMCSGILRSEVTEHVLTQSAFAA